MELVMDHSMTRRQFVRAAGAGTAMVVVPEGMAIGQQDKPMATPAPAPSNAGELRFRQIHLDFHTSPLIHDVAVEFKPEEFVAVLKRANVDSINVFAKDHHGMSYHPTKVGQMHPHLKFDLLGAMLDACRSANIRTPVYMSLMWDMKCAEEHADWRALDAQGKPIGAGPLEAGWLLICPNTPYGEYLEAQAEEIARNYDAEGFWFDILFYSENGCFCPYCMAEREKLGLDSTKVEDRLTQYQGVVQRTMARLSAAVHRHRKSALIYFNGRLRIGAGFRNDLQYFTHLEIESLPGGQWGYGYFATMARYTRNLGLDYLGMTGRFHRTWGDFGTLRNAAALDYECFRMLAHAGKCCIGDQLHPRGRMVSAVYERIGKTYASVRDKEPWCVGARAVTEIGVISDASFLSSGGLLDTDLGATRMLAELQYQFDILDRDSELSKYRLIVLPDSHTVDESLHLKLQAYLKQGGSLLLSHRAGLGPDGKTFVLEEAGITYIGPSPNQGNKGDYFVASGDLGRDIPQMVHFTYGAGSVVTCHDGAKALEQEWKPYFDRNYLHFSSHGQTAYEAPLDQPAVAGRGNVLYIAFPVFENYARNGYAPHKMLVRNCIEQLMPNPMLRVQAPSTAEVTVTEQPGRKMIHLLHYPAERRGTDIDVVEDVIPLFNIPLSVKASRRPRQVYLAPGLQMLPWSFEGGYVKLTVPEVHGHAMVVVED
jgi:hypothetical protein